MTPLCIQTETVRRRCAASSRTRNPVFMSRGIFRGCVVYTRAKPCFLSRHFAMDRCITSGSSRLRVNTGIRVCRHESFAARCEHPPCLGGFILRPGARLLHVLFLRVNTLPLLSKNSASHAVMPVLGVKCAALSSISAVFHLFAHIDRPPRGPRRASRFHNADSQRLSKGAL